MKYCAECANFMRSFKHLRKIMYCDSFKVKTSYTVSKLVKLGFDGNISSSSCENFQSASRALNFSILLAVKF